MSSPSFFLRRVNMVKFMNHLVICIQFLLKFSSFFFLNRLSNYFLMFSFLFYLHLSVIISLLLRRKVFFKSHSRLLCCPILLLFEFLHCLFSQWSVLFSCEETWRHLSSFLKIFLSSMLIIFLLLFLILSSAAFFHSNKWISKITLKNHSLSLFERFSFFFFKLLLFLCWLLKLWLENISIVISFFMNSMFLLFSQSLKLSLSSTHFFVNQWIHFVINFSFRHFLIISTFVWSKSLAKSMRCLRSNWNLVVSMSKSLGFISICVSQISSIHWLGSRSRSCFWRDVGSLRSRWRLVSDITPAHDGCNSWACNSVWRSSVGNSYGLINSLPLIN